MKIKIQKMYCKWECIKDYKDFWISNKTKYIHLVNNKLGIWQKVFLIIHNCVRIFGTTKIQYIILLMVILL